MRKTAIVMDSTGYLTPDLLEQLQIEVVSLSVTLNGQTYLETELPNAVFFSQSSKTSGLAITSQPSVGAFLEVYEKLFATGIEEIVSIHLSQALSGTLRAAQMAKSMTPRQAIHIFDSGSAALGLGLLAWVAAEWAQKGRRAAEIISELNVLKKQTELYFIVDNLENLRRGGRIGGAAALLGNLLQIKPILYVDGKGEINVLDKVRSRTRAWQRVLDELTRAMQTGRNYRICVQHVGIPEEGEKLLAEVQKCYPEQDVRLFEAGPVIATHVGPGAFGLAFQPYPLK